MAFKNLFKKNTYSTIENIAVDKKNRYIFFELVCYENETKQNIFTKNKFEFIMNKEVVEVEKVFKNKEDINTNEKCLVLENFYGIYENKIPIGTPERVKCNKTYYKFTGNSYIEYDGFDLKEKFDELKITNENIYKVCYELCKKIDIFRNIEDC